MGVDLGLAGEPQGTLDVHRPRPQSRRHARRVSAVATGRRNHNPVWQNCQYYDTAVPNERAVHSLEHGAVWITYAPETSQADRDVLKALADTGDHIIVSRVRRPCRHRSWRLHGASSCNFRRSTILELKQFVQVFENGPQTPEPGVTCRDSTSDTTPVG